MNSFFLFFIIFSPEFLLFSLFIIYLIIIIIQIIDINNSLKKMSIEMNKCYLMREVMVKWKIKRYIHIHTAHRLINHRLCHFHYDNTNHNYYYFRSI